MSSLNIDETVRRHLADRDVRYTMGRKAVVRALHRSTGPQSAADIHARVKPPVPLSSLYRSLVILEGAGVVAAHHSQGPVARFELAEWLTGHHHHVVCVSCGRVDDVSLDPTAEKALDELVGKVALATGFTVAEHALEIEGTCPVCQS
ncbi:MAG: Fur family transcriptional regulator [Acidimicrobiia bacterium]